MVIADADKYGLATLHQLRGRIGRGKTDSVCFLLTSAPPTPAGGGTSSPAARKVGAEGESPSSISEQGAARVETIAKNLDGFKIAREDLKLRGEGNILGARQSGVRSSLKLLRVLDDIEIIERAHELAVTTVSDDPTLAANPGLRVAVDLELREQEREFLSKS
jgi:ATP-dependent DNA helicase RecG